MPRSSWMIGLGVVLAGVALAQAQSQHRGHGSGSAPARQSASKPSDAQKAYMAAMDKMHKPMMDAGRERDADIAFVKGMIPHHQGAIDMAKIVLQHGKDEQVKKWASDVIAVQQREIEEMQAWLQKRPK